MKNSNPVAYAEDDGDLLNFDVKALLTRCWELRRKVIALAAVFAALIFAVVFWVACQYSSEGFLRAPRKFAEFNAQKAAFWDRETLRHYLEENKKLDDAAGRYLLGALNERFIQAHLQAVLPLSKDDLRYITDAKGALEAVGILGFSIGFKDRSPESAQARVQLLGDFVKDTMLGEDLQETIYTKAGEIKAKKQQIDNQIIQKKVTLAQAASRLEAARTIAGKYPEASKMEARQLLSTGSDSESSRYLSPMAQLVGIETEMANLKSQLALLERDSEQNALRSDFYERMVPRASQTLTGNMLLTEFVKTAQAVFTGKNLQDDQTREVYNQIMLVAEQMRTKHVTEARFVSGPTLPDSRSGPSSLALLLLSLIGGSLLAGAIVLILDKMRNPVTAVEDDGRDEETDAEESLRPVRVA